MSEFIVIESTDDQWRLLRLARRTAQRQLGLGVDEPVEKRAVEGVYGGAFVTFWRDGVVPRLRGCVGVFGRTEDIAATVQEMTLASLKDARFATAPITADELGMIDIEVSILSDLLETDDPLSLVPGRHGIIVRHPIGTGCFLPKVAEDRGWSAEAFLSTCCTMKAGLPADAWRSPETKVLLFEAQAIRESMLAGHAEDKEGGSLV